MIVVDAGAAPGAWSQYASSRIEPDGAVLAIDLLALSPLASILPGVQAFRGDFTSAPVTTRFVQAIRQHTSLTSRQAAKVDVILSDMLGNLSGDDVRDSQHSIDLCSAVLDFALAHLASANSAALVMKHLASDIATAWQRDSLEPRFERVQVFKPVSSRDESREAFFTYPSCLLSLPNVTPRSTRDDDHLIPAKEQEQGQYYTADQYAPRPRLATAARSVESILTPDRSAAMQPSVRPELITTRHAYMSCDTSSTIR
ncbi:uncharacterized protein L969DRAFT_96383 [Mixia osmundae IAM 14324]|uniref:rRNA methyltransferase 2, mitochondrial n=1 Tax=Mixia osmundae (strain CBS 9802 / IAM 14324 / JCM 22182 / KY 12970) TaxID=764103 RepID=G7DX53_MIXOS|nr:uncharacterized protein L969DRAFT_96383 [Mixia osmundae IAM 14324]KEI37300.1 hypothetical protein L969DRAFT_96383 [Mixia osmundae IAM 14324]GAA95163.1 hypothetical protein E5Q_01818 [Mixia osmundae IAM 14324]